VAARQADGLELGDLARVIMYVLAEQRSALALPAPARPPAR